MSIVIDDESKLGFELLSLRERLPDLFNDPFNDLNDPVPDVDWETIFSLIEKKSHENRAIYKKVFGFEFSHSDSEEKVVVKVTTEGSTYKDFVYEVELSKDSEPTLSFTEVRIKKSVHDRRYAGLWVFQPQREPTWEDIREMMKESTFAPE